MWGSRNARDGEVTCIACGAATPRSSAREYDKYGDRWDRDGKEFEFVCKACHRDLCRQPRGDLESLLLETEATAGSRDSFLARYTELAEERSCSHEGSERERER